MSILKKNIASKVRVPVLNINRKKSVEVNEISFLRQKERDNNVSPRTNRSFSSEQASAHKTPIKLRENPSKTSHAPRQIHSKLSCECAICQNKLNDSIEPPELRLDSFFEEELIGLMSDKDKNSEREKMSQFEMEKSSVFRNISQASPLKSGMLLTSTENEIIDKDFLFILKRLIPSKNSIYSLRILIPDTVVFHNGEAKLLAFNGKDDFLKCVRQKEKLSLVEIKNFFIDRKSKRENQLLSIQESILLSLIGLTSPRRASMKSPNRKSTGFNARISLLPEDLSPNLVDGLDLKKVQETMKIKRFNDNTNSAIKEFAFVRYKDSISYFLSYNFHDNIFLSDNVRILSEMEFLNLMTKRRIEKALNDVIYLQSFLKPKKGTDSLIRVKFVYEKEKHKELFAKSLSEICALTNLRPPQEDKELNLADQESYQFEVDLKKRNFTEYSYFLTYKIVHYIEAFYGMKIEKFIAEYLKDDFNNLWLMNCCHIKSYDPNVNHYKENDYVLKKVNLIDKEQKNAIITDLETYYNKSSKNRKKKIDKISNTFITNYEKTKEQLGIDLDAKTPEDSFSDNVFKNLNPKNPFTLSHILKNSHKIQLKRYVLQNFPENLIKYEKDTKEREAINSRINNKEQIKIRPTSHKVVKTTDITKSTNFTSFNKTLSNKFGLNYESKSKKQEKFLSLCHNGFFQPKNIDYNNLLGEFSNLRKDTGENEPIKLKNNFEMKKMKEKKKTYQITNNFFKEKKEIEPNAIELSKYGLKNLQYTLPFLLYHKRK